MFIFLLSKAIAKSINLASNKEFRFETEIKEQELFKFEYHVEKNANVMCNVIDDLSRTILDQQTNFTVAHWSPSRTSTFFFTFKNEGKVPIDIYFRTPDVNTEMHSPIGPITDKDILAEFDNALKRNIQEQRAYLESMNEHEAMTRSTRRIVGYLVLVEILSIAGFIFFLHKKTVMLFEKRHRA
ncbi:hypothetical protein COBT_003204 [Conglomerata obtusa]